MELEGPFERKGVPPGLPTSRSDNQIPHRPSPLTVFSTRCLPPRPPPVSTRKDRSLKPWNQLVSAVLCLKPAPPDPFCFCFSFSVQVPSKSPFAAPLERMQRLMPLMEEEVAASEEVLTDLLDKLSDMVRQP